MSASMFAVRKPSFRDDTGLIGLRYEKTIAAEPPIPVTSRNAVAARNSSSSNRTVPSRQASLSATSLHSQYSQQSHRSIRSHLTQRSQRSQQQRQQRHRPIVVAPPTEEHPALRSTPLSSLPPSPSSVQASSSTSSLPLSTSSATSSPSVQRTPRPRNSTTQHAGNEWKRDSGVARTNSSASATATIHEVDEENVERECDDGGSCIEQRTKDAAVAHELIVPEPVPVPDSVSVSVSVAADDEDPFVEDAVVAVRTTSHSHNDNGLGSGTDPARVALFSGPPSLSTSSTSSVPSSSVPSSAFASRPSSPSPDPFRSSSSLSSSRVSSSPRKFYEALSLKTVTRFRTKSQVATTEAMSLSLERGQSPPPLAGLVPVAATTSAESSATSNATAATSATVTGTAAANVTCTSTSTTTASTAIATGSPSKSKGYSRFWSRPDSATTSSSSNSDYDLPFSPLDISIPCENFLEDDFMSTLSFSKRGSIMFGAKSNPHLLYEQNLPSFDAPNSNNSNSHHDITTQNMSAASNDNGRCTPTPASPAAPTTPRTPNSRSSSKKRSSVDTITSGSDKNNTDNKLDSSATYQSPSSPPDIRVQAADVEKESQKVRSLYTVGDGPDCLESTSQALSEHNTNVPHPNRLSPDWATLRSGNVSSQSLDRPRYSNGSPGSIEDWEDLEGAHVDRYGFISLPPPPGSRVGTPTEMRSAQYSPRRRNVLRKHDGAGFSSPLSGRRTPTRKVSARSLNTQATQASELSVSASLRSSRSVIRQASNLLPHNRDRRWMDEAGDMLNASPSIQDILEEVKAERISDALKRKEWERSEKWRKMAKVVQKAGEGQGMEFEFDTKNPKLIDRTWKGIPDRWRAAAWWSFLAAEATDRADCASEEDVVIEFHRLQHRHSPDDVQIDLDVPRTVNRHIMFRRRYRGGQRLLFRVLHAISIYFPETGYVQGMASLAATLLCYFDEEKAFVMLVRMWQLRGLARLYRPGFEDLIAALGDLNTRWLNKDVANKLNELCIDPTAYGTRWYLTLFNLSIPFPAQLRVWDVFLLLGSTSTPEPSPDSNTPDETYDVLHATSAALAQALREVLLDSDFENAMKALTSSIPIKDEDLLMKVMKAEWKGHHGKKKA